MWVKEIDPFSTTSSVNSVMMPVRLIMNNKTLTVMEGVSFDKTVHIFNLGDTDILQQVQKGCFVLEEKNGNINGENKFDMEFCPFGISGKGSDWMHEWDYDFNLFKHQCAVPRYNTAGELDPEEEAALNEKVNQMKVDVINKKEKNIYHAQEEEKVEEENNQLDNDELEVVAKEFDFEEMAMKEEEEKEGNAQEELTKELEKEKEKRECLLKRIKQKEIENQYNLAKEFDQKSLEEDKSEQQKLIKIKRNQMKTRLEALRARAKRREDLIKQKIKTVRFEMGHDIDKAYKKAPLDQCKFEDTKDKKYCNAKFSTDPISYGNCLEKSNDKETFCVFCCENEIGAVYIDSRQTCADKCLGKIQETDNPQKWFFGMPLGGVNNIV